MTNSIGKDYDKLLRTRTRENTKPRSASIDAVSAWDDPDHARPPFIDRILWVRLQYYSRFQKLLSFLQQNLNRRVHLSDLAQAACMSPPALSRLFKTRIGITLTEFVEAYKVSKAHDMMIRCDLSITEIAGALGFVSLSTFERTFRRVSGKTPSQYRIEILESRGTLLPRTRPMMRDAARRDKDKKADDKNTRGDTPFLQP